MMPRVYLVTNCVVCPNCSLITERAADGEVRHGLLCKTTQNINWKFITIPEWCPLPEEKSE